MGKERGTGVRREVANRPENWVYSRGTAVRARGKFKESWYREGRGVNIYTGRREKVKGDR